VPQDAHTSSAAATASSSAFVSSVDLIIVSINLPALLCLSEHSFIYHTKEEEDRRRRIGGGGLLSRDSMEANRKS
jgi:hypothetical protein